MTTLENAAAVLKLFSQRQITHGQGGISFTEVVERMRLPKSTVSRLLQTMESQGLLERDPQSRQYHIGYLLLGVASHYLSTPLVESATAAMMQLNQLTFCTGYISVLEGRKNWVMRTLLVMVLLSVLGAIIGVQLITTLGVTPNTSIIGALIAMLLARIPLRMFQRYRSIHTQNLAQTVISSATFGAANSLLMPIAVPYVMGQPQLILPMFCGVAAGCLPVVTAV